MLRFSSTSHRHSRLTLSCFNQFYLECRASSFWDNLYTSTRCAVALCTNSLQATKKKNLNISYHIFPKDQKLCNAWVNSCRRKDE
ncbi:THAP domain-containing protein 2-like [Aphis craccivora]|uniref:THAP domain-containing protein 2-like n=1 Tax=Aphis craccivora TaxID=307492 RepID=A0A6G0W052_APHCR|nr:THAP domain-containing protein 2-like [Aphis craccivora]